MWRNDWHPEGEVIRGKFESHALKIGFRHKKLSFYVYFSGQVSRMEVTAQKPKHIRSVSDVLPLPVKIIYLQQETVPPLYWRRKLARSRVSIFFRSQRVNSWVFWILIYYRHFYIRIIIFPLMPSAASNSRFWYCFETVHGENIYRFRG